jgi:hypothetical protein
VKIDADKCDGINPNNTCFDDLGYPVPPQDADCCDHIEAVAFDSPTCWTVTLKSGCTFTQILLSSGSDCDDSPGVVFNADKSQATICNVNLLSPTGNPKNISHLEICFECCN